MPTERTITIPQWSVGSLEKAVRTLARAARRAGIAEPTFRVHHETRRELNQVREETTVIEGSVEGVSAKRSVVPVVDCSIQIPDSGKFGIEGNWRVLASLERVEQVDAAEGAGAGKKLTNEICTSAADLPRVEPFRHAVLTCDHCKAHRNRTKTFVIENSEDGAMRQVGKECAVFYVGDRADQMIRELEFRDFVATILKPFEEANPERGYGSLGSGVLTAWDADEIVAHAAACVRQRGWQPSSERIPGAGEDRYEPNPDATWRHVELMLTHGQRWEHEAAVAKRELESYRAAVAELTANPSAEAATALPVFQKRIASLEQLKQPIPPYTVTDEDRARARAILDWLAAQPADPADQYLTSMQAAYAPGWISEKKLPFAVSVVRAFERAAEIAEERRLSALSNYVGAVGDRIDLTLTLQRAIPYGGPFPGTVYVFRDSDGNSFSWKTSSGYMGSADVGRTFKFKATIKKHEKFKETKTTELARVKILEEIKSEDTNADPLPEREAKPPTNGHSH